MKALFAALLLQFTCVLSNAQVIYYDSLWNPIPFNVNAHFYREIEQRHDTFFVRDYYISGALQMTGSYLESTCKTKHGKFTYYYENGQKSSEGFYHRNIPNASWRYWNQAGEEENFVETMPEFPGGMEAMISFIVKEMNYPKDARKNSVEGRVVVEFVVGPDGLITQIEVVKPVYPTLDAEAIRVVSKMPKWKPGTQNGKPIFVRFKLPIVFKLK